jgi:hypothetical protein
MDAYRIPRRVVPVRLLLDDGRRLHGDLFVATVDGSDFESLVRRLNDPEEDFVPLAVGDDRFLLQKAGIVSVEIDQAAPTEEQPGVRFVTARLTLMGGTALLGRLRVEMPPERSRVLDYLNAGPRFIPLWSPSGIILVQRRAIVSVRADD